MREDVLSILSGTSADSIIITDRSNIRYISGFCGEGTLVITAEKNYLLTDSRYTVQAQSETSGYEILEVKGGDYGALYAFLSKKHGFKRALFENLSISHANFILLEKSLNCHLAELYGRLTELRQVKTDREISHIKKAAEIADNAFYAVLKELKEGVSEREIAAFIEYTMKKSGADGVSFDTIAASGENSAMPHAVPSDRKLRRGDFLTLDFGCKYNGYCSDMTRTVIIGTASAKQREIYYWVLKAQETALAIIKAGLAGREADAAARSVIEKAGFGEYFGHGLGHSVGLDIHEEPRLSPKEEALLAAGNVVTVEPGIYIKDFGGVRIEDLCVVKENGIENLTHSPKKLIEL